MLLRLPDGTCDTETGVVRRGDTTDTLTTKERELLDYLARRAGQVVPTEELLREVWGYAASAETRAVFHTCRRLRAKIEPDPSAPSLVLAERSVGYRLVAPVGVAPVVAAPVASAAPPPSSLRPPPAERNRFFGREGELDTVAARFARGDRLVTLVGMGGMGKTRLATHFALTRWQGPAAFCDLVAARTDIDVAVAVLAGVGTRADDERPAAVVPRRCAELGECLLVVDNAESALEATRNLLGACLDAAPDLRILVTSRAPLGLAGESRLPVFGLEPAAAVALMEARADGEPVDASTLGAVAARLGGVPLALELAAARTALVGPGALRALLAEGGEAWVHALSDASGGERHRHMVRVLDGTCALLPAGSTLALGQLAVFEGGFPMEAAEAVGAASALDLLLRAALVRRVSDGRFAMLPLVQSYAREQLGERQLTLARDRHADWVRAYLTAPGRTLAHRQDEQENLLAACDWAIRARRADAGTMVELAWKVLSATGSVSRAREVASAVAGLDDLPPAEAARAARGAMFVLRRVGELRAALSAAERLEQAGRQLGEADPEAQGASVAGYLLYLLGDTAGARKAIERAREVAVHASASVRAAVDGRLATIERAEGNLEAALAHLVDAAGRSGGEPERCNLWCRAADVRLLLGDVAGAREAVDHAARNAPENAMARLDVHAIRTAIQAEAGELTEAEARLFLEHARRVGDVYFIHRATSLLLGVITEQERWQEAVELAHTALTETAPGPRPRAMTLAALARAEARAGLPDAQAHLDEAAALLADLPAQWEQRGLTTVRAEVAWLGGDTEAARAHLLHASTMGPHAPLWERRLRARIGP